MADAKWDILADSKLAAVSRSENNNLHPSRSQSNLNSRPSTTATPNMALSGVQQRHYLKPELSEPRGRERTFVSPPACINPKQHLVEFRMARRLGLWYPTSDHTVLEKKDIHDVSDEFQDFDEAGLAEEKYLRFESFFRDQSKSLKGLPRDLLIWPERALRPSTNGSGVIAYIRLVGFRRWKHVKACNKLLSSKDWASMYSPPLRLCYDIQPSGLQLNAGPRDARLLGLQPLETLCGSLVLVGSGEDERTVTVGGLIEVNQKSWAITTSHLPCPSSGPTSEDAEIDDEDSDFGDDLDSALDPALITMPRDEGQNDKPRGDSPGVSGDIATGPSTILGQIGPEGNDWALIPIDEPTLRLPNSFCPMGSGQAIYLSQEADKPSSDLIWAIAGVTGSFQARMSPARIQIPLPSGVWVNVWKVKFEGSECELSECYCSPSFVFPPNFRTALHRGDSGSWVASEDGMIFGQIIARTDDYAYLIPLRDLLDEITIKTQATERARLPNAFDILVDLAHAWFHKASAWTEDHDVAMATSRRLANQAINPRILSWSSGSKGAKLIETYLSSRLPTSSLTERMLVEALMRAESLAGLAAELRLMRQKEAAYLSSQDLQLSAGKDMEIQQAMGTTNNLVKPPKYVPPAQITQSPQMDTSAEKDAGQMSPRNSEPRPEETRQRDADTTVVRDADALSYGLQGQQPASPTTRKETRVLIPKTLTSEEYTKSPQATGVAGPEVIDVADDILRATKYLRYLALDKSTASRERALTTNFNALVSMATRLKQQIAKEDDGNITTSATLTGDTTDEDRYRWQTLYQIGTIIDEEPLWRESPDGFLVPEINKPIWNLDTYLMFDLNDDIAFYAVECYTRPRNPDTRDPARALPDTMNMTLPQPDSRFVKIRSPALREAIEALLKNLPGFYERSPEIFDGFTLREPELFWYHYQSHFAKDIELLPTMQKNAMRLFQHWVEHEYGAEWRYVEARFREGLVSPASLKYLVKPGDVLVSYRASKVESSMAQMWARLGSFDEDTTTRRVDWNRAPLMSDMKASRTEWEVPPHIHSSPAPIYEWGVQSWGWMFDGFTFRPSVKQTSVKMIAESPQHFVKISSLDTIPIRFADKDLEERLRKRGHTSWRLRQPNLFSTKCSQGGRLTGVVSHLHVQV